MRTRFILIHTSHAGNVGAAARAMKTMGFDDLVLVAPRWPNVLRREETIQRASGALDVLTQARIVQTLDEALDGMTHLCATAMTPRDFGPPTETPRQHFEKFKQTLCKTLSKKELLALAAQGVEPKNTLNHLHDLNDPDDLNHPQGIAFLFGSERFGMSNEDVYRCHVALSIATNPQFGSLNLGAAVQLIAYEWRQALGGFASEPSVPSAPIVPTAAPHLADAQQIAGMLAHWQQALTAIGFFDPLAPKKLMPRLNQLFNRAQLSTEEIHILRGIAKAMLHSKRPLNPMDSLDSLDSLD